MHHSPLSLLTPAVLAGVFAFAGPGQVAAAETGSGPTAPPAPTLVRPSGVYQTAWLDLATPNGKSRLFLAFRDGKGVSVWLVGLSLPGSPKPGANPQLVTDDNGFTLSGTTVRGAARLMHISGRGGPKYMFTLTLEGDITKGTFVQEMKADGQKESGAFTGVLSSEADLTKTQSFAK